MGDIVAIDKVGLGIFLGVSTLELDSLPWYCFGVSITCVV